ncbi:MAG: hypothetical protein ACTS6P_01220 [Candidatus Hodgkinia cicadicola]
MVKIEWIVCFSHERRKVELRVIIEHEICFRLFENMFDDLSFY